LRKVEINLTDIPTIFQINEAQESQQETIEQIITELQHTNKNIEKLARISYEQTKLIEKLKNENSRD